jgi:alpha-1,2-mannosyltransferase
MAEEMCLAPDGTPKWGSGVTGNRWFLLYIFLIGATPITILLLGPRIVFALGKAVGYYLKKKTAGRRSQILETVEADEKEFLENRETQDNDDWESVDAYAAGTVKNGEPAQKEFDGIIGFFHPFWWVCLRSVMC